MSLGHQVVLGKRISVPLCTSVSASIKWGGGGACLPGVGVRVGGLCVQVSLGVPPLCGHQPLASEYDWAHSTGGILGLLHPTTQPPRNGVAVPQAN